MQIEQPEVLRKWLHTGFLRDVPVHMLQEAAERLEMAYRSCAGSHNRDAFDRELLAMSREGFFGRSMNSAQPRR